MPSLLSATLLASAATSALAAGHISYPIKHRAVAGAQEGLQRRTASYAGALLTNHSYTSYLIDLEIGTPPQTISLQVDTGSSNMWMNVNCDNAADVEFCKVQPQFNADDSSTWKPLNETLTLTYGSGNVTINQGADVVRIPAAEGGSTITISSLQFGVIEQSYSVSNGLIGVSFGELGEVTEFPNIIDQLALSNLTNGRVFSLALGNLTNVQAADGVLIFGGIDTKKFVGDLVPLPNLPVQKTDPFPIPRYWVNMDSISINGTEVVPGHDNLTTTNTPITSPQVFSDINGPVILDSGTSFLQLPTTFMESIAKAMGGTVYDDTVIVDCAWQLSPGSLQFVFGESNTDYVVIDVPLGSIVLGDSGSCGLGVQSSDGDNMIMGDILLRQAYCLFDQDKEYIYMAPFADCGSAEETLPQLADGEFFNYTGQCQTSGFVEELAAISSAAVLATASPTATTNGGSTAATSGVASSGTAAAKSSAGRSFAASAALLVAGFAVSLLI
ncbi:hypothetical protein SCUCBS95973_001967 [Sporothrix curviconia]|uniref:Peptidase A1 domain-containing protein n=1 Tax=Sporothrix curviconia TaxID=1260050 RepID=A0ABP0B3V8_9PEZI